MSISSQAESCGRRTWLRKFLLHSFQPYLCFGLAAVLLLTTSYPLAEESRPTESQVESAYLYNFGKFVTWPAGHAAASDLFEICVLGRDPFGTVLDSTVTGESIDGKKIAVRRLSTMQEAQPCNILYISSSEENRLAMILETAQRLNLLTVSNIKHFAGRGGTIGLVLREDKVRFEVNRAAAARSHLTLSSELLKVAVNIIEKNTPEVK